MFAKQVGIVEAQSRLKVLAMAKEITPTHRPNQILRTPALPRSAERLERYGDCFVLFYMPFL